ncbi:helix-turn-helix domain-containing protein [Portibacter marinus]|uniref:ArsR family transcriptional regulator n=1 Tax=Portibacter marinus TaxID=2898660 RepID=UPI001F235B9C|nr:ArsR family transcriptional regulator [Portibacter marinus]
MNSNTKAYLRGLSNEFGESSNAIRVELNRLEDAGMLKSTSVGNKKFFSANTSHPLFGEVHNILMKYVGFDQIIERVVSRLGEVDQVYVTGDLSRGMNSEIIDLLFIGNIDKNYLIELIEKAEEFISKKIRYITYSREEADKIDWEKFKPKPLLLWAIES